MHSGKFAQLAPATTTPGLISDSPTGAPGASANTGRGWRECDPAPPWHRSFNTQRLPGCGRWQLWPGFQPPPLPHLTPHVQHLSYTSACACHTCVGRDTAWRGSGATRVCVTLDSSSMQSGRGVWMRMNVDNSLRSAPMRGVRTALGVTAACVPEGSPPIPTARTVSTRMSVRMNPPAPTRSV